MALSLIVGSWIRNFGKMVPRVEKWFNSAGGSFIHGRFLMVVALIGLFFSFLCFEGLPYVHIMGVRYSVSFPVSQKGSNI